MQWSIQWHWQRLDAFSLYCSIFFGQFSIQRMLQCTLLFLWKQPIREKKSFHLKNLKNLNLRMLPHHQFSGHSPCSLVGFSQAYSTSQECFPLTTNQHQPAQTSLETNQRTRWLSLRWIKWRFFSGGSPDFCCLTWDLDRLQVCLSW